ncbi:MAG: hypothetical protein AAF664_13085 [Planctomycetota bacterium]
MTVLSVLALLLDMLVGFSTLIDALRLAVSGQLLTGFVVSAITVLVFILHLIVLAGCHDLVRGNSTRYSYAAAIIACIPIITPGVLVGIPFGIWSLVAIRDRN